MGLSRRSFLVRASFPLWVTPWLCNGNSKSDSPSSRRFHVSITVDALEHEPELIEVFSQSGVDEVWLCGFLYGHWYYTPEKLVEWRSRIESAGMGVHVINVPLGHPGDSLGSYDGKVPLTPPDHWRLAQGPDGGKYAGTALHPPAIEENANAVQVLSRLNFKKLFLDDDFRLARSPGQIGGCFCEEHKKEFLHQYGYVSTDWEELLDAVRNRKFTKVLRDWVNYQCDLLTGCFRALEASAREMALGIMVMYMGSEKAGIRLTDYRDRLVRVGEGMFDDQSFGTVKNKCNELFSVLFHRRFVSPERAFSETTAFPADKLSADNMCAKLVISTIADVRNTMFMSGIRHFPITHWDRLREAIRKQIRFHLELAGHRLKGPLKHFWGEPSRFISDDNPYSLFLALGIPFEVTNQISEDGWTFVSDYDVDCIPTGYERHCITRIPHPRSRQVIENFDDLLKLKHEILPLIKNTPHIIEDIPVICAWYPTVRKVLLWNVTEERRELTLSRNDKTMRVTLESLDSVLCDDLS